MNFTTIVAALAVTACATLAAPAHAASELIQNTSNAVAVCQGALPVFETSLRKRPLGISHEGNSGAFLSCSFPTSKDSPGSAIVAYFGGYFTNANTTDRTVTCTGIQGFAADPNNVYETQTVTVLANNVPGTDTTGYIFFGPGQGDPQYYQNVSMSCQLPVGVSLNDTYVGYYIDDAASNPL